MEKPEGRNSSSTLEKVCRYRRHLRDLFHWRHRTPPQSELCHHHHRQKERLCPRPSGKYHPPQNPITCLHQSCQSASYQRYHWHQKPSRHCQVTTSQSAWKLQMKHSRREIKGAIRTLQCYPRYTGLCGYICKIDEGVGRRLKGGVGRKKFKFSTPTIVTN